MHTTLYLGSVDVNDLFSCGLTAILVNNQLNHTNMTKWKKYAIQVASYLTFHI